jgi:WD40 repeat protein
MQQTHIYNLIQNNNINTNQEENKRINLIKVYKNNSSKLNYSNDMCNQNEINTDKYNDDEEEDLEINYKFRSMAYIKQKNLLCLIIDNCKDIYLFDIIKREALKEKLSKHKKEVLDLLALKDDNLASYGEDFAIRIWNMKRLQNTTTINVEIKKHYFYFTQLLYGNLIFSTNQNTVKILKLPEFEFEKDITIVPEPVNYFELPDKRLIVSLDDGYVRILKPPDYKVVNILYNRKRTKISSFLLLDNQRLLVGLNDYALEIIYFNDKNHKNSSAISSHFSPIASLIKTKDDKDNRVISISCDNVVKIFLVGD